MPDDLPLYVKVLMAAYGIVLVLIFWHDHASAKRAGQKPDARCRGCGTPFPADIGSCHECGRLSGKRGALTVAFVLLYIALDIAAEVWRILR